MIIYPNGILKYKISSGGGKDENGDPIPVDASWSDPIECHIDTNTHNNRGKYQDGNFIVASYMIFISMQEFNAERISLILDGKELGEFSIQDIQRKHVNQKIVITV